MVKKLCKNCRHCIRFNECVLNTNIYYCLKFRGSYNSVRTTLNQDACDYFEIKDNCNIWITLTWDFASEYKKYYLNKYNINKNGIAISNENKKLKKKIIKIKEMIKTM